MKVFVSYKRYDSDSETLLSLLEAGLGSFVTVYSDRLLNAGVEWRPDLLKMIDRCDIFVVLISEKAAGSDEVGEEVRRAYDRWVGSKRKKPIMIKVRVNYTGSIEAFRRNLNDLQELTWKEEKDSKKVLAGIRNEVRK